MVVTKPGFSFGKKMVRQNLERKPWFKARYEVKARSKVKRRSRHCTYTMTSFTVDSHCGNMNLISLSALR